MLFFWHDILDRVNAASHTLQDPKLDLNTAVAMKCLYVKNKSPLQEEEGKGDVWN